MKFHIYRDRKGEWRWRLIALNGRKVANSGEGYTRKWSAVRAILKIRNELGWQYAVENELDGPNRY